MKYLIMVRKKAKDSKVDTELVYAYAKTKQLGPLEEFISSPNQANLQVRLLIAALSSSVCLDNTCPVRYNAGCSACCICLPLCKKGGGLFACTLQLSMHVFHFGAESVLSS